MKTNKKGFGLIGILIAVGVLAVVAGGGYYYVQQNVTVKDYKVDEEGNVIEEEVVSGVPKGYSEYTGDIIPVYFVYPDNFDINDNIGDLGLGSIILSLTKYDHKRGKSIDCGGYALQSDELSMRITLHDKDLPYFKDYDGKSEIELGGNVMKVNRNIGGMCGNSDGYFMRLDNGSSIEIYVSPSETQYLNEAERILSTLRLN